MMEMQLDLFAPPPPVPTKAGPFQQRYCVNPKRVWESHAGIRVRQNDTGGWEWSVDYGIHMYCGGGGPFSGDLPTFEAAMTKAIARLLKQCRHTAFLDNSSCCGKSQKADALKLVEWLEGLAAEYGITDLPARGAPFTNELMGYAA